MTFSLITSRTVFVWEAYYSQIIINNNDRLIYVLPVAKDIYIGEREKICKRLE